MIFTGRHYSASTLTAFIALLAMFGRFLQNAAQSWRCLARRLLVTSHVWRSERAFKFLFAACDVSNIVLEVGISCYERVSMIHAIFSRMDSSMMTSNLSRDVNEYRLIFGLFPLQTLGSRTWNDWCCGYITTLIWF